MLSASKVNAQRCLITGGAALATAAFALLKSSDSKQVSALRPLIACEANTGIPRYVAVQFPPTESPFVRKLFDGVSLAGWEGKLGQYWNAKGGEILGISMGGEPGGHPVASSYLLSTTHHKHFRLIFEVKIDGTQDIHSGVSLWGQRFTYKGEDFSYQGHLVMVQKAGLESNEWGVFELYRRGWNLGGVSGAWAPGGRCESGNHGNADAAEASEASNCHRDGWHLIEILAIENQLQVVLNGKQIVNYTEPHPHLIKEGPLGLQLHWIQKPWNDTIGDQRVRFRGLWLVEDPEPWLLTKVA